MLLLVVSLIVSVLLEKARVEFLAERVIHKWAARNAFTMIGKRFNDCRYTRGIHWWQIQQRAGFLIGVQAASGDKHGYAVCNLQSGNVTTEWYE